VIGGYIPGSSTFDSILVEYYEGSDLTYAARIRNGFTPASRRMVLSNFGGLSVSKCPFRNLPESGKGRWGEGLNAEDMKKYRWLKPQLVAAIEFLEWTQDKDLRHPKFVAPREDRIAGETVREVLSEEPVWPANNGTKVIITKKDSEIRTVEQWFNLAPPKGGIEQWCARPKRVRVCARLVCRWRRTVHTAGTARAAQLSR